MQQVFATYPESNTNIDYIDYFGNHGNGLLLALLASSLDDGSFALNKMKCSSRTKT